MRQITTGLASFIRVVISVAILPIAEITSGSLTKQSASRNTLFASSLVMSSPGMQPEKYSAFY
jgi:hypothetical protein